MKGLNSSDRALCQHAAGCALWATTRLSQRCSGYSQALVALAAESYAAYCFFNSSWMWMGYTGGPAENGFALLFALLFTWTLAAVFVAWVEKPWMAFLKKKGW